MPSTAMHRKLKKLYLALVTAGAILLVYHERSLIPDSKAFRCASKKNVMFLKMHKSASSSIFNLLMRHAEEHNLLVGMPKPKVKFLGYPTHFDPAKHLLDFSTFGIKPNMLTLHMRLNLTAVKQVMPQDTVYITIIRNPIDLFLSLFYYFKLNEVYSINITQFLREPFLLDVLRHSRLHHSLGFNQMAFDLGVEAADLEDPATVDRLIRTVDDHFHLVMVAERFLESLVLLRNLLCWDTDDVIAFEHNARRTKRPHLPPSALNMLRRLNFADDALYSFFAQKFEKIVEAFGKERMHDEVVLLESRHKFWYKRCILRDFRTWDSKVYEYSMRIQKSSTEASMCHHLSLPEQAFTDRVRRRILRLYDELRLNSTHTRWGEEFHVD